MSATTESPSPHGAPDADARLLHAWTRLEAHVRGCGWRGYDPRDALRSPLFAWLPGKWPRIAATQLLARLPFNPRPWLGYGPADDPKALSLFLRGYVRTMGLEGTAGEASAHGAAEVFARLKAIAGGAPASLDPMGWGYPFPWQSRHLYVPAHAPNAVVTAFVGEALLDLAEAAPGRGDQALSKATWTLVLRTAAYALRLHPRVTTPEGICFHYTHFDTNRIHNASLLLAAFLARFAEAALSRVEKDGDPDAEHAVDAGLGLMARECRLLAASAIAHGVAHQEESGAWPYGEGNAQRWRDSFHTGYSLLALLEARHAIPATELPPGVDAAIERGYADYRRRFFRPGETVLLDDSGRGPIDPHAVAHAALTLVAFGEPDAGREQLLLLLDAMQDPATGRIYYRRSPGGFTNRVDYIRWTQAWVFLALSAAVAPPPPLPG